MSGARLSALDASFLAVETPTAHMHVGWVALFSPDTTGRLPSFTQLRDHIELRLGRAPRYRQKLAPVPFGLHAPEWIDDPAFSVDRHVYWAPGSLSEIVDEVMSMPLRRDRPLWEIWICENPKEREVALIGKAHHCMVDGIAAVELGSLLLDPTPEPAVCEPEDWCAAPEPDGVALLARGARDLIGEQLGLLRWPLHAATSPSRAVCELAGAVPRVARVLGHSLRAAPASPLNRPLSPRRSLLWAQRPLDDLRQVKRAYGTTVNDVLLAAVAGGARTFIDRRGEQPVALKAMVPVNVRDEHDVLGNHVSFVFTELPCEEPDPVRRLERVHTLMTQRKHDHEPEGADLAFRAAEHTPGVVQHAISRVFASPRTFNLVVSNIPGPVQPLYMLGCPLQAAYPVVPLADHHALSVGMTTVRDRACFGIYTDREAIPDADHFAHDIDAEITELLACTKRSSTPAATHDRHVAKMASTTGPSSTSSTRISTAKTIGPASLSSEQIEDLGVEFDAIRERVLNDLGERDADYIRGVIRAQRRLELAGRGLLFFGFIPPAWLGGVTALSLSKILENMEIGHNVMHGQYDWMNDPDLEGRAFEWDNACPADSWRHSHNYLHHTHTNVLGKDRDIGYGILRMSEDQAWRPYYLGNPLYAALLAIFFQYGVALHDLEIERILTGETTVGEKREVLQAIWRKARRQTVKDYVLFPLLSGPAAPLVLAGDASANLVRNLWAFTIIFCGHFPDGTVQFSEQETAEESRGGWYHRQLLGSANLTGGQLFHTLSGNLSYQIEHHLFPDLPSHRYGEIAVEVREICNRHGLPYNAGSLPRQFGSVTRKITRLALPDRTKPTTPP